jgi:hypothetical protein
MTAARGEAKAKELKRVAALIALVLVASLLHAPSTPSDSLYALAVEVWTWRVPLDDQVSATWQLVLMAVLANKVVAMVGSGSDQCPLPVAAVVLSVVVVSVVLVVVVLLEVVGLLH